MLPSRIAWQLRSSPWRIGLARLSPANGTLTAFITPERCGDSRGWVGGTTCPLGLAVVNCRRETDIDNPCTPFYFQMDRSGTSVRLSISAYSPRVRHSLLLL